MVATFSRNIGNRTMTLESGKLAQQINGSVVIQYGDSVLLVTAGMPRPRCSAISLMRLVPWLRKKRVLACGIVRSNLLSRPGDLRRH